jgi:hypothetical protein
MEANLFLTLVTNGFSCIEPVKNYVNGGHQRITYVSSIIAINSLHMPLFPLHQNELAQTVFENTPKGKQSLELQKRSKE